MKQGWWREVGLPAFTSSIVHYVLLIAAIFVPAWQKQTYFVTLTGNHFFNVFMQFDATFYYVIAKYGYNCFAPGAQTLLHEMGNTGVIDSRLTLAFFPLLVVVTRYLTPVVALMLTNLLFIASVFMFSHWVHKRGRSSWTGTLLLAISPGAVFFSSIYPETWILFTTLVVMLCSTKGSRLWLLACVAGFISSSVTGLGILIGVFTLAFWMNREWIRGIVFTVCVISGWVLVALNCVNLGAPALFFIHSQKYWQRTWSFPFEPWLKQFFEKAPSLALQGHMDQLVVFICTILMVSVIIAAKKRQALKSATLMWSVLYMLFSVSTMASIPIISQIRYLSAIAPMYDVFDKGKATVPWKSFLVVIFALFYFHNALQFTHGLVGQ